jgi:hypothetical protein
MKAFHRVVQNAAVAAAIGLPSLILTPAAIAGPPAPCGYYYGTLTPRPCASLHPYSEQPRPTARCRDGTYSFQAGGGRACADHGGVQDWL